MVLELRVLTNSRNTKSLWLAVANYMPRARCSLLINYPLRVSKGRIGSMGGPTGGSQELVGGGFFPFFESVAASVYAVSYVGGWQCYNFVSSGHQ